MHTYFQSVLIAAALVTGCATTVTHESEVSSLAIGPLTFPPNASDLAVTEVARLFDASFQSAASYPASIFVELVHGSDTAGQFDVAPSYASLAAFVDDMIGQSATYKWEIVEDVVFVYPRAGGFLNTTVGASTYEDVVFCSLIKKIAEEHFSQNAGGCFFLSLGNRLQEPWPAGIVGVAGSDVGAFDAIHTHSATRVLDFFVTATGKAQRRFSATGAPALSGGLPMWSISL